MKFLDQVQIPPFQMKYDLMAKDITQRQDQWENVSCARRTVAMCVKNVVRVSTQNYACNFFVRSKSSI